MKDVWSRVISPFVLHLEDDWLALEPITPDRVFPRRTRAEKLVTKELGWNGRDEFRRRTEKVRFLSVRIWKRKYPNFGTSPAFFSGDFIQECSALLVPDLDPEKQQRAHYNRPFTDFTSRYQCRLLSGIKQPEMIVDIGRKWRENQGVSKKSKNGRSVWDNAMQNR
ncbi:hypothetical protein [Mesorhizobium sp. M0019]|uniref:hypothetical protein n=1 Tax=Mesorhizobium sp. M0019 TaxID=2956845 RepID=UPI00333562D2